MMDEPIEAAQRDAASLRRVGREPAMTVIGIKEGRGESARREPGGGLGDVLGYQRGYDDVRDGGELGQRVEPGRLASRLAGETRRSFHRPVDDGHEPRLVSRC